MSSFKLDANNIVIAVMSFDPCEPDALPLATYDTSIIGKRYNTDTGEFTEVPAPVETEQQPEPTNE